MRTGFFIKELKELVKTPRLIIIASIFVFFAILGPLTAKYMNEIFAMFAGEIEINFPNPTFRQAWEQFYSNISSLCLIVYLIVMTGTIVAEKTRGSVYLVLTKNVSRTNFIMSKVAAGTILFTTVYLVALLISYYYTKVLFDEVLYSGLAISLFMMWLMGIFYTVFALFISIISKSSTIAALLGFAGYAVLSIFNMISGLVKYNPVGSSTMALRILAGDSSTGDNIINIVATLIGIVILITASLMVFRKQEL